MKPEQLNVPEDKFQAQVGLSWKDALASGEGLKAMDGNAKLGVDADQMRLPRSPGGSAAASTMSMTLVSTKWDPGSNSAL